jgi:NAD(P)-dependent dehydrogenase (short-subunit alcohol dehydrogenase family)
VSTSPRVAIVTGAARGIGAGVAKRVAADGLAVAVVDLDEAARKSVVDEIEATGGRALAVGVDVSAESGGCNPGGGHRPVSWATRPCWSTTQASSATTACSR